MESEERAAWSVYTNPFLLEQIVTSAKVKDLHLYDASSEFSKEMLEVASYSDYSCLAERLQQEPILLSFEFGNNLLSTCKVIIELLDKMKCITVLGKPLLTKDTLLSLKDISTIFFKRVVSVSVFGLHNAGKSTLLNALLGESVLPANQLSETSVTVKIQHSVDPIPELIVQTAETKKNTTTGPKDISKAIQELNRAVRNGLIPPPLGVVLKMKTGVLACGVPSGWEVSLVDNPGFGENNEYVDQVANGAVGSSAAYIFLTTMACIGGKSNAQFYKHLKSVDISAFSDGRLLIGVTKFDENYHDMDEDESRESLVSPEAVAKRICMGVHTTTGIKIDPNIVIPISARWIVYSNNLQKCLLEMNKSASHDPEKIREFRKKRTRVECALRAYPDLDIECGQDSDISRALTELPAALLVEKLSGASRVPLLKQRIQSMLSEACVSTWRTKVFGGSDLCLNEARIDLGKAAGKLTAAILERNHELQHLQKQCESVAVKKAELEASGKGEEKGSLWRELEDKVDQDMRCDSLQQGGKLVVENLVNAFSSQCQTRINDIQDHFGPLELDRELDIFLLRGSVEINLFFDHAFVFTSVPSVMLERVGALGEIYNELCTRAHEFLSCEDDSFMEVSTDGREKDDLLKSTSTNVTNTKSPRNLGDLKSNIYIPPVTLSRWDRLKKFFKSILRKTDEELAGKFAPYKSFEEIKRTVENLRVHLHEECAKYAMQVKPMAVQYYYSEFQRQVSKRLCQFELIYGERLVQRKLDLQKLDMTVSGHNRTWNFVFRVQTHVSSLKEKLKKEYSCTCK